MVNQSGDARMVAYLRDSGGTDQELSVLQQELEVRSYCKNNGYTITRIFKDEARSGKTVAGREQFTEMVRYLQSGGQREKGCVVWEYARLARDIDTAQLYKADLRMRGYVIVSIKDNVPEGTDGRLLESIIDWKNQKYLDDLSANVRRGQSFIATIHKGFPSGRTPKGYKVEKTAIGRRRDGRTHYVRRLVPNEEMSDRVKKAFEMRAKGMGYKEIHDEVNLFESKQMYSHMFRNPIYIGRLRWNELIVEEFCEPIVDQESYGRVQEINRNNEERMGVYHPRSSGSKYLLSGMMQCSCGRRIVVTRNGGYQYYTCNSKWDYGGRCGTGTIKTDRLDRIILDKVKETIVDPANLEEIQNRLIERMSGVSYESKMAKTRLNNELAQVRKKMRNLANAIAEYGHSTMMLGDLDGLQKREQQLNEELYKYAHEIEIPNAMARIDLETLGKLIGDQLDNASLRDKQLLLRSMIRTIQLTIKNGVPAGSMWLKEVPGMGEIEKEVVI